MDITLYHSPGACSMATYISLIEADADFNVEIISIRDNQHLSNEYTAINPKRKVPFLVVDGKGLSENVAIQGWIADTFSEARLLPEDDWNRAQAVSYMGWFGAGIHPHITRHFKPQKFCGSPDAEAGVKAKAKALLFEQLALVDAELEGRTYFFDHLTTCDAYFFWIFDRALREKFDLSEFANCEAHNNRMRERKSVARVLAHKAP